MKNTLRKSSREIHVSSLIDEGLVTNKSNKEEDANVLETKELIRQC